MSRMGDPLTDPPGRLDVYVRERFNREISYDRSSK